MAERAFDPAQPPVTLTIAGSDSGGGAGVQADLKTFTVLGCFPATAVTALTAQNSQGVRGVSLVSPAMIRQQIDALADDMAPAAAKTGMIGSREAIGEVRKAIAQRPLGPLVVDPVMLAKSGDSLLDDGAVAAMRQQLLPLARVVTPNRFEVRRLLESDLRLDTVDQASRAAQQICERFGCPACVVKGLAVEGQVLDVLYEGGSAGHVQRVAGPRYDHQQTHGSGCAFSAAIASFLATGRSLTEAVNHAKTFISTAIAAAPAVGSGTRPVNPLAWAKQPA
jgi:hydroxymethylpyrimidine/phosphomethylpyrimidine kinase